MKKVVSVVLVFLLVFTSFSIVKSTEIKDSGNFDSLSEIMDRINVSIAMDEEGWERLYEEPYFGYREYISNSSGFLFEEPFIYYHDFEEIWDVNHYWYDDEILKLRNSNTNIEQNPKPRPIFEDGKTLYVGGNGPNNYTSIQDAINNASDGDTVFVYDDSSPYYENVIVDKSIILSGENRNTTIIDGNGQGDIIYIVADYVNLNSFTIRNGNNGMHTYASSNNIITGNTIAANTMEGIFLQHSSNNNIITGNTIAANYDGIYLEYSSNNNIITGNTIAANNFYGIFIACYHLPEFSNNNIITNNTVRANGMDGIYLMMSSNNTVSGNTVTANNDGIKVSQWSNNNTITANNITANANEGISIEIYSSNNTITDNTIRANWEDGISLHYLANNNTITNNTITANTIHGVGLFYFCSNNIIIGNTLSENSRSGIALVYSSECNNISGNLCISNHIDGIGLYESSTNTIEHNTCLENMKGIAVRVSSNNTLVNNTCDNNQQGILLNTANYTDISNNTCSHNNIGIYLFNSNRITISGNHCNYSSYEGIALVKSTDNSLKYNDIEFNYNGLVMTESDSNDVTYNDIYDNTAIGIALQKTKGNKINYNNIHDNTGYGLAGVNCFDNARFNWWGRSIPLFFRDVLFWGWVRIFPWLLRPVDTSNKPGDGLERKWVFPIDYGERVHHTCSEEKTSTIRARAKDENWVLLGDPSLRIGGYP